VRLSCGGADAFTKAGVWLPPGLKIRSFFIKKERTETIALLITGSSMQLLVPPIWLYHVYVPPGHSSVLTIFKM
jgi:hypothetical protein